MKHQLSLDTRTLYLQSQNKLQNKFQTKINVNKLNLKKNTSAYHNNMIPQRRRGHANDVT
jgi:hypothetical protein